MAATRKQRNAANNRKKTQTEIKKNDITISDYSIVGSQINSSNNASPSPAANTRSATAAAAVSAVSSDLLLAESIGSRSMRQKKVLINAKMQVMSSVQWKDKYGKEFGAQPPKSIIEQPTVNSDHKEVLSVETGVEKHEEKEEHLKKILQNKDSMKHEYIPTPDASKLWTAYNELEVPKFVNPEHYIISSATLEQCYGIEYLMDEEDDEFLVKENLKDKITDDQFELICQIFEEIVNEHQPFLTVEPDSILSYDDLNDILNNKLKENIPLLKTSLCSSTTNEEKGINIALKKELLHKLNIPNYIKLIWESDTTNKTLSPENENSTLEKLKLFGNKIFDHWRQRKLKSNGDTIKPHLRFEKNGEKNDNDPYICFRRREVRQVRKTRKMDKINSQKLYILLEQLERTHEIIHQVNTREVIQQEKLSSWEKIYRQRKLIRDNKIALSEEVATTVMIDANNLNNLSKKKQFVNSTGEISDALIESVDFELRRKLNLQLEEIKFVKENKIEELKEKINKKSQQKLAAKKKKQQERARKRQAKLEEERQLKKRKTTKGTANASTSSGTSGSGTSGDKKSKILKDLDPNNITGSLSSSYAQQQQQQQQQRIKSSVYTEAKNNSIPEHDLKNVDYILNEKQRQTKQFFEDSMFKRYCEDSNPNYVNFTDCTLNPSMDFNIPSNMLNTGAAISSSLSASNFDVFNIGYNPIFDPTRDETFTKPDSYSPELSQYYNKKAISSNVKIINSSGEILNADHFDSSNQSKANDNNPLHDLFGISTPKSNIDDSFDKYIMPEIYQMDAEYKHASMKEQTGRSGSIEKQHTKELPFLNRKRISRFNEVFIDKQYNHLNQVENKPTDILNEFFDFGEIETQENVNVLAALVSEEKKGTNENTVIDVYSSEKDSYMRMADRWKFDADHYIHDPPLVETSSTLNNIPRETQVIRFSTMLGTKASDKMKEVQHQYRRDLINKVKKDQLRRQKYVEQVRRKQKQMLQLQLQ
ncbi:hypothetical protein HANVADRAFT_54032, partial [Hanseniaspora valbyensis NRRL Y-1626]